MKLERILKTILEKQWIRDMIIISILNVIFIFSLMLTSFSDIVRMSIPVVLSFGAIFVWNRIIRYAHLKDMEKRLKNFSPQNVL